MEPSCTWQRPPAVFDPDKFQGWHHLWRTRTCSCSFVFYLFAVAPPIFTDLMLWRVEQFFFFFWKDFKIFVGHWGGGFFLLLYFEDHVHMRHHSLGKIIVTLFSIGLHMIWKKIYEPRTTWIIIIKSKRKKKDILPNDSYMRNLPCNNSSLS